jgi:SAM-dependent methyltransferase
MPVLVTTEGLDPFYKQYSFDIILLANVYNHLLNREIYFKELRPSLKKNGRLLIIHRKPIVDYNNVLSTHLNKITEKLYSEGENFPLYHRLSKMVQNLLKDEPIVESLSEDTRNAMIRDIQTSFLDRYLFNDFYNYYRNKENKRLYLVLLERHSRHISLIQWLANQLHEKGVFNPLEDDRVILTDSDKRNLHKLNSLLISDILEIPELILDWPLILIIDKDHVISTMDTAGYQFLRSYDIFPEFYLLEFEGKN